MTLLVCDAKLANLLIVKKHRFVPYLVGDSLRLSLGNDFGDFAGVFGGHDSIFNNGCWVGGFRGDWLRDDGGLLLGLGDDDWDFGRDDLRGVRSFNDGDLGDAGCKFCHDDVFGDG